MTPKREKIKLNENALKLFEKYLKLKNTQKFPVRNNFEILNLELYVSINLIFEIILTC